MSLKIVSIIPARSGSKSIPDKNILSLNGKPMISYSISDSLNSKLINRTIVSTDSLYYSEIAKSFGAEVPFLRPIEISQDHSTDFEVFEHAIKYLIEVENYYPDIVVHLRPTYPYRKVEDIDKMIQMLILNRNWDSVRSVCESQETPYKMWNINNGQLVPLMSQNDFFESYNQPRQKLPKVFLQNANVDVIRVSTIIDKNSMTGDSIGAYIMNDNYDIDYFSDLEKIDLKISETKNKTFCFDIDGVIAKLSPNNDYNLCEPNQHIIDKINALYENNTIIIFTARGSKTYIDWQKVTVEQLDKWKVKYHTLKFGKPAADFYIDDRMLAINKIN